MDLKTLATKMDPKALGFSPRMAAILGAILGHDYGVRDVRGNHLTSISITSDGFILASTNPVSSGAFIGDATDLQTNLEMLLEAAHLTPEEGILFEQTYKSNVTDWRS